MGDGDGAAEFEAWEQSRRGTDAAAEQAALSALATVLCQAAVAQARRLASGDVDLANDLLQDAWSRFQAQMVVGFSRREQGFPRSYFRAVLLSAAQDHGRRRARRPEVSLEALAGVDPAARAVLDLSSGEEAELVRRAFTVLAAETSGSRYDIAGLLRAYYFEGRSASDIAASIGKNTNTVEQAISRARLRMWEIIVRLRGGQTP